MERVNLAHSDIVVSPVCLGTWQFNDGLTTDIQWEPQTFDVSKAIFDKAIQLGINFFDTAEAYPGSEVVLGKIIEGRRKDIVISSKYGQVRPHTTAAEDIETSLNQSLKRLQTDYIDIYHVHWPSVIANEDYKGAVVELERQKSLGRIREYGISNFGPKNLDKFLNEAGGKPVTNQIGYSLLCRCAEFGTLEVCKKHNISAMAYSPLAQGLLTGKFWKLDDVPEGRRRSRMFNKDSCARQRHGQKGCEPQLFEAIARVKSIVDRENIPMSKAALSWLWQEGGCDTVVVGASRPEQLVANCDVLKLSKSILKELTQATEELKEALGPNMDLWAPEPRCS